MFIKAKAFRQKRQEIESEGDTESSIYRITENASEQPICMMSGYLIMYSLVDRNLRFPSEWLTVRRDTLQRHRAHHFKRNILYRSSINRQYWISLAYVSHSYLGTTVTDCVRKFYLGDVIELLLRNVIHHKKAAMPVTHTLHVVWP